LALFDVVRKEGKKIAIGIRDTGADENNPFSALERYDTIKLMVPDAFIFIMPDIDEVCYGRGVGWKVREIRLDEKTEKISATEIRRATV
jgi:hypothetical protein